VQVFILDLTLTTSDDDLISGTILQARGDLRTQLTGSYVADVVNMIVLNSDGSRG
jgi:hypothetical protein